MAAPTPTAVRIVRRGVRTTLRNGIRVSVDPGSGIRPVQSLIRPAFAVRCPVRMASIGSTRTARHTGTAAATIGTTKPSTAAWA